MLEHGGNLRAAMAQFSRPQAHWIDLSTGINPQPYPVAAQAADAWHRLPEAFPGLIAAACAYYRAPDLLAVAGTQAAIQSLPHLRSPSRVVVAAPSYAEHAHQWRRAGHAVREIPYHDLAAAVDECDVLVVCNPNNPTGAIISPEVLHAWADNLRARGGWLVVDEAFGDTVPALSIAPLSAHAGIIVLRSVGKFFGLAGLRLGFVGAQPSLLSALQEALGPWTVSGPAQQIGYTALRDVAWQNAMRAQLCAAGAQLHALLAAHGIAAQGTALFQWWPEPHAAACRQHMAEQGIWVRMFTSGAGGIRLGLPPDVASWQRLATALAGWVTIKGTL